MKEWSSSEARAQFSKIVEDAQQEPQIILLHGVPSVVMINIEIFQKTKPLKKEGKMASLVKELAKIKIPEKDEPFETIPKQYKKIKPDRD